MQIVHLLRQGEDGLPAQFLPSWPQDIPKLPFGSRHQFNLSEFTPLHEGFDSASVSMRGRGVETLLDMQASFHVWLDPRMCQNEIA